MSISIVCPRCNRESFHPKDVEEKFCSACGMFHEDIYQRLGMEAREQGLERSANPFAFAYEAWERGFQLQCVIDHHKTKPQSS